MQQTNLVRGTATKVVETAGRVAVQYHDTVVATLVRDGGARRVTLNSGGWKTNTTKTRMNQFASEFCGDQFRVSQEKGTWFVYRPMGPAGVLTREEFVDGMTFDL